MVGIEPAVIKMTSVGGFTNLDHNICALFKVIRLIAFNPLDIATDTSFLLSGHGPTGQHRVDGRAKVLAGERLSVAGPAVVQLAAVDEFAVLVVQKEIGCASRLVGYRDLLRRVVQERELPLLFQSERPQARGFSFETRALPINPAAPVTTIIL